MSYNYLAMSELCSYLKIMYTDLIDPCVVLKCGYVGS